MRLVRLQNGGSTTSSDDNTSNFTTYFNPPMEIPKDSEIALQSMSLKLRPDVVTITDETADVAFSTLEETEANYDAYVALHTATLPSGEFTTTEIGNNFTTEINKTLFFSSTGDLVKEQGAEIFMQVEPLTNISSVTFAARLENEYCAPPTDQVTVNTGGAVYDYTVTVLPPTSATLARTAATVTEVDSWLSTNSVFCRGSGAVQWTDGYNYELPGTWTDFDTFTSTADFNIANLGFGAGDIFFTTASGGSEPFQANTVTQGGVGGNKAVITIPDIIADGADSVILQAGPGWVVGLIASQYLADPATILDNIEYGVALPNSAMAYLGNITWLVPSFYHSKSSKSASWDIQPDIANGIYGGNQTVLQMILGRRDGAGGEPAAGYALHIEEYATDGTTYMDKIDTIPYVYGNYHLVMGVCTTGTSLSGIRWTASKINNAPTGYYERAAPDLALRDDGLVLPTTNGVTFFPSGVGRFTLDLLNQTTATLYGYSAIRTPSSRVNSSSTKTVTVRAQSAVDFTYSFSENLTMLLNLPLDSYDRGIQRNVLSSIPFGVQTLTDDTVVHQPPFPNFIRIKNAQPLYIDALTVRLENDQGVIIDPQNSVSVSLLLRPTMR